MSSTMPAGTKQKLSIMDSLVKSTPILREFMGMRIRSGEGTGLPIGNIVLWPTLTSQNWSEMTSEEIAPRIGLITGVSPS